MCTQKELKRALKINPDSAILFAAARRVWEGSKATVTIELVANQKLIECIHSFGLTEFKGLFITNDDMRHIMNHHSQNEDRRGQANIVASDFALLPIILNDFDSCEESRSDQLGNKTFEFTKNIDSKYYVVTIQRGKRKLQIRTMWKMKSKEK